MRQESQTRAGQTEREQRDNDIARQNINDRQGQGDAGGNARNQTIDAIEQIDGIGDAYREGDRLYIEVKDVQRQNFQGNVEAVNMTRTFNIPLL